MEVLKYSSTTNVIIKVKLFKFHSFPCKLGKVVLIGKNGFVLFKQ